MKTELKLIWFCNNLRGKSDLQDSCVVCQTAIAEVEKGQWNSYTCSSHASILLLLIFSVRYIYIAKGCIICLAI